MTARALRLAKEQRLRPQVITVLSLFVLDVVSKFRQYDAVGYSLKGEYARIFEEEFRRAANLPEYRTLFGEVDLAILELLAQCGWQGIAIDLESHVESVDGA